MGDARIGEEPSARANGGFTVAKRVPGQANPRLYLLLVKPDHAFRNSVGKLGCDIARVGHAFRSEREELGLDSLAKSSKAGYTQMSFLTSSVFLERDERAAAT